MADEMNKKKKTVVVDVSEKERCEIKLIKTETWAKKLSILAVIGAAVWTLYTFGSFREVYKAEAEVTDQESRDVSLELSISKNEFGVDEKGRYGVELGVTIENKGILPVDVDLADKETFTLSHIVDVVYKEDENKNIQYVDIMPVEKVYSAKAYNRLTKKVIRQITSSSVRPNSKNTINYFFYLD